MPRAKLPCCTATVCAALALAAGWQRSASAVAPDAPEVRQVTERALTWLETQDDQRLGGKCLIGLAFFKAGRKLDHPKIVAAQRACETSLNEAGDLDNYSVGLALVFLLETSPDRNLSLARRYMEEALRRQQSWGSWSYPNDAQGDTSQTQYPTLGLWLAINHGLSVPIAAVEKTCAWLLRTQDPGGGWAYKGLDPGHYNRVTQTEPEIRPALVAAGLGSLLITADTLGLLEDKKKQEESAVPAALKPVADPLALPKTSSLVIDPRLVRRAIADGNRWFSLHNTLESPGHSAYYIYAFERYQSFREAAERRSDTNPRWYNDVFNHLKTRQTAAGSWNEPGDADGEVIATSFYVLTLLRSTKKTIVTHTVSKGGKGVMLGGMGLPAKTSDLQERDGKLLESPLAGSLDEILTTLEQGDNAEIQRLAELSSRTTLDSDVARRSGQIAKLRALVAAGPVQSRLVAVRTLAKVRDFDNVPVLIYALQDSDPRIIHEADAGLRFISRKFDGFGPPPEPRDAGKTATAWKGWFRSIRPGAEFLD